MNVESRQTLRAYLTKPTLRIGLSSADLKQRSTAIVGRRWIGAVLGAAGALLAILSCLTGTRNAVTGERCTDNGGVSM